MRKGQRLFYLSRNLLSGLNPERGRWYICSVCNQYVEPNDRNSHKLRHIERGEYKGRDIPVNQDVYKRLDKLRRRTPLGEVETFSELLEDILHMVRMYSA